MLLAILFFKKKVSTKGMNKQSFLNQFKILKNTSKSPLMGSQCNLGLMYLRFRSLRGGYKRRVGMEVCMAVERKGLNIYKRSNVKCLLNILENTINGD